METETSWAVEQTPADDLDEAVVWKVEHKWRGAVDTHSGFAAVPVSLLRYQADLKLSATDIVVLCNLIAHWWQPDAPVFPRTGTIAKRMGVDARTVQRSLKRLVDLGYIDRDYLENGRRVLRIDPLAAKLVRRMKSGGARPLNA